MVDCQQIDVVAGEDVVVDYVEGSRQIQKGKREFSRVNNQKNVGLHISVRTISVECKAW